MITTSRRWCVRELIGVVTRVLSSRAHCHARIVAIAARIVRSTGPCVSFVSPRDGAPGPSHGGGRGARAGVVVARRGHQAAAAARHARHDPDHREAVQVAPTPLALDLGLSREQQRRGVRQVHRVPRETEARKSAIS